jgi:hypothetical protein
MFLLKMQAQTDNIFIFVLQMGEQGWIASLSVASSDEANGIVPIDTKLRDIAKVHSCRPAIIFRFH